MISGTDRWYDIGALLVTSVYTGLTTKPNRYGQVPGEIAWDDCDCGGLLAVTTPRVYLSEVFPGETEETISARCRAPYEVAEYTVSVLRCAPQPQGQAAAPTPEALDAASLLLLQDISETMAAVTALLCARQEADDISDYLITPASSAGPEGACVGFTLRVLISLERA